MVLVLIWRLMVMKQVKYLLLWILNCGEGEEDKLRFLAVKDLMSNW